MKDGKLGIDAHLYCFRRHFDKCHGDGASVVKVDLTQMDDEANWAISSEVKTFYASARRNYAANPR